jgi:hypothetical protein
MFDDSQFYRFNDLREMGFAPTWATLRVWMQRHGFPPGTLIGANHRVWTGLELNEYIRSRPVDSRAPRKAVARAEGVAS